MVFKVGKTKKKNEREKLVFPHKNIINFPQCVWINWARVESINFMEIDALNGNICMFFHRKEHRKKYFFEVFRLYQKDNTLDLDQASLKANRRRKRQLILERHPKGLFNLSRQCNEKIKRASERFWLFMWTKNWKLLVPLRGEQWKKRLPRIFWGKV
jgi:hypothetical protein